MNKRADNILVLGIVALVVVAGLAFFLGRSTAPANGAGSTSAPVTQSEDGSGSRGGTEQDRSDNEFGYDSIVNSVPVPGYENQTINIAALPPEALETIDAISTDGPYEYGKDGSTFQNREGLLPDHEIGYYREFTVTTPGSSDRGARRIVAGDNWEMFYTSDHYESFEQIVADGS